MPEFEDYRAGYSADWSRMKVDAGRTADVDKAARRILAVKARYQTVSAATGVPWFLIGLLHLREADLSFSTHLHNGDSLKRRTVHVPAGRPKQPDPPYSWEESAIDALRFDGLTKIDAWSLERIAYQAEAYNGFGPRKRGRASGYLWAGSNVYTGGKFVADGVWDPDYRDRQLGVMPVLQRLAQLDVDVGVAISHLAGLPATRRPITAADAKASMPAVQAVQTATYTTAPVAGTAAGAHSWVAVAIVVGVVVAIAVTATVLIRQRHARLVAAANSEE